MAAIATATYKVDMTVRTNEDGTFTLIASITGAWGHRHSISRTAPTVAEAWAAASDFGKKLEDWATRTYPDADE